VPGETFTFVAGVRNATSVPISLLGLRASDTVASDYNWTGLGLLRDPTMMSSKPEDVVRFTPVSLDPGQEVPIVIVGRAGRCADPGGPIPPSRIPIEHGTQYDVGPVLELVYEVAGWRQSAWVYPYLQATIPIRPGCLQG
jgi:hypothetical protein